MAGLVAQATFFWMVPVCLLVGFAIGYFVAGVRRKTDPQLSGDDTRKIHAELEAVRAQQQQTLSELRERIESVQAAKAKAEDERARLLHGLAEATGGKVDEAAGVTVALMNIKDVEAAEEHTRLLERHDTVVADHVDELEKLQEELSAAEELLREVDTQRSALEGELKDRDKELWKLRSEFESTQRKSVEQRARTMMLTRSNVRKTEVIANRLEDQLKHWVRKTGEINTNWAEHGKAVIVQEVFAKLDRDFIDRYFSHATNPEYARGQRRSIRVHAEKDPDGTEYGELIIALDDEKGRTLGLRFDVRKTAPDVRYVGFILAMYLRALHRDFRDFEILPR